MPRGKRDENQAAGPEGAAGLVRCVYKGPGPGERVERPWWGPDRECGHWFYVEECGVCVGLFQEELREQTEKVWGAWEAGPPYEVRGCGHWVFEKGCEVCAEDARGAELLLEGLGVMRVADEAT